MGQHRRMLQLLFGADRVELRSHLVCGSHRLQGLLSTDLGSGNRGKGNKLDAPARIGIVGSQEV